MDFGTLGQKLSLSKVPCIHLPLIRVFEESEPVAVRVLDTGAHAVEDGDVAALGGHVDAEHVQGGHRRALYNLRV